MSKTDSRWIWIALGLFSIILRIILGSFPEVIEQYYSRGLFVGVRNIFDYSIGMIPIPFLYVLILGVLCFVFYRIFRKKGNELSLKKRIINITFSITAFLSGLIFLFLFLWGFNYGRVPIEEQMGIEPRALSKEELKKEFLVSTEEMVAAYDKIKNYDQAFFKRYIFEENISNKIRQEVGRTFKDLGYPVPGRLQVRMLYPKGSLLRISTAGFYLPLTGECNVDPGLHPLQMPYVISHELAHGYGIGDEGTCNFIAYLTCTSSKDPIMNYTGFFSYWRSVAGQYRAANPDHYKAVRASIPEGIGEHLKLINEEMDKYPDIFPAVRDATYNAYLKTQGIDEGLKNYSRVVLLVRAYRNDGLKI